MDFNVTEHKKFTDMVSDPTLKVTLKELPLTKFWYSTKEENSQLCKRPLMYSSLPARFFSYNLAKITYHSRLNAETRMRI